MTSFVVGLMIHDQSTFSLRQLPVTALYVHVHRAVHSIRINTPRTQREETMHEIKRP